MWRKTDNYICKNLVLSLSLLGITSWVSASTLNCQNPTPSLAPLCTNNFKDSRQKLNDHYLTALLISDAPIRLLHDSQALWLKRAQQCKNNQCYQQQFDHRIDDLNSYMSLNQSLTQHYLKFEQGKLAAHPVHLKVHQLSKNNIKIEALAYRHPNNRADRQTIPFLAYTHPSEKNQILDNEHDCKYQFEYTKALLVIKTTQQGCERFNGIYRLYD